MNPQPPDSTHGNRAPGHRAAANRVAGNRIGVRKRKTPPQGETGQEGLYLKSLSERQALVTVKLYGGDRVRGWIEYFDDRMIRLTREGKPNLFIYKHHIQTISEESRRPRREGSPA